MLWNLFILTGLTLAFGIFALVHALRLAGVEDGIPILAPSSDAPLDLAFREEPVQTFMWQVQVARYWQPPFRRH